MATTLDSFLVDIGKMKKKKLAFSWLRNDLLEIRLNNFSHRILELFPSKI
jgi:hypothetical protein